MAGLFVWISKHKILLIIAATVAIFAATIFFVDRWRHAERDQYWQNKIASAPVQRETTYVHIPASAPPIHRRTPTISAFVDSAYRARQDSIILAARDSIALFGELIYQYTTPRYSEIDDSIVVNQGIESLRFAIPIKVSVFTSVLDDLQEVWVTPGKFEMPQIQIRETTIVERERPWYEIPVAVVVVAGAYYLGTRAR